MVTNVTIQGSILVSANKAERRAKHSKETDRISPAMKLEHLDNSNMEPEKAFRGYLGQG